MIRVSGNVIRGATLYGLGALVPPLLPEFLSYPNALGLSYIGNEISWKGGRSRCIVTLTFYYLSHY